MMGMRSSASTDIIIRLEEQIFFKTIANETLKVSITLYYACTADAKTFSVANFWTTQKFAQINSWTNYCLKVCHAIDVFIFNH